MSDSQSFAAIRAAKTSLRLAALWLARKKFAARYRTEVNVETHRPRRRFRRGGAVSVSSTLSSVQELRESARRLSSSLSAEISSTMGLT